MYSVFCSGIRFKSNLPNTVYGHMYIWAPYNAIKPQQGQQDHHTENVVYTDVYRRASSPLRPRTSSIQY